MKFVTENKMNIKSNSKQGYQENTNQGEKTRECLRNLSGMIKV